MDARALSAEVTTPTAIYAGSVLDAARLSPLNARRRLFLTVGAGDVNEAGPERPPILHGRNDVTKSWFRAAPRAPVKLRAYGRTHFGVGGTADIYTAVKTSEHCDAFAAGKRHGSRYSSSVPAPTFLVGDRGIPASSSRTRTAS